MSVISPGITSTHSRQSSQAQNPIKATRKDSLPSKPSSPALDPSSSSASGAPHYTVFIRLPFNRDGFEDPAAIDWNSTKDKALWKIISKATQSKEIDWEDMSQRFGVELGFLLQQSAWLYERHFEGMRAQMKKLTVGSVGGSEGGSGTSSGVGGVKMERTGSAGRSADSKLAAASRLTTITAGALKRESPTPPQPQTTGVSDGPSSVTSPTSAARPQFSRSPSTATVTQSKVIGSSSGKPHGIFQRSLRTSSGSGRRPAPPAAAAHDEYSDDAIEHEGHSDSDSEEEPSAVARSQAFRRGPIAKRRSKGINMRMRKSSNPAGDAESNEDDDEDSGEGGFLPFATTASEARREDSKPPPQRVPHQRATRPPPPTTAADPAPRSVRQPYGRTTTTESSASSASGPPGALSPKHRAQLVNLSPRSRHDGSDGSPSMGSSFSDLDDASVTQSALEEALLSNMRTQGGAAGSSMASRMSSLRDALGRRTVGGS